MLRLIGWLVWSLGIGGFLGGCFAPFENSTPLCEERPNHPACRTFTDASVDQSVPDASRCNPPCTDSVCNEETGLCVECVTEANCDAGEMCWPDNECGECIMDTNCPDRAAPVCNTTNRVCGSCTDPTDCDRFLDARICDAGTCVLCTVADPSACGGRPCTPGRQCSEFPFGMQDQCEPCDTDENCDTGLRCVEMMFDGVTSAVCLAPQEGACPRGAPASIRGPSVSGAGGTYCGPDPARTTCEAYLDMLSVDRDCVDSSQCAPGGVCRDVAGMFCTIPCDGNADCPNETSIDRCVDDTATMTRHCGPNS
ncbi:MAG: hypothetical protein AAGF12_06490 [Myxococcota bacterium]